MTDNWLVEWKRELGRASRSSLKFSIACTIVFFVSRYGTDHVSNLFGLPLMLAYIISIPAVIVTTVLLGSTFPSWNDHAPYLFILIMTFFNYLFYSTVIAAFRSLRRNRIGTANL